MENDGEFKMANDGQSEMLDGRCKMNNGNSIITLNAIRFSNSAP